MYIRPIPVSLVALLITATSPKHEAIDPKTWQYSTPAQQSDWDSLDLYDVLKDARVPTRPRKGSRHVRVAKDTLVKRQLTIDIYETREEDSGGAKKDSRTLPFCLNIFPILLSWIDGGS